MFERTKHRVHVVPEPATARANRRLRQRARRRGFDLVPRGYYSVVNEVDPLDPEVWTRRSPMRGIHFDRGTQMSWAEANLAPAIAEWTAEQPDGWEPSNGYFESVDVMPARFNIEASTPSSRQAV